MIIGNTIIKPKETKETEITTKEKINVKEEKVETIIPEIQVEETKPTEEIKEEVKVAEEVKPTKETKEEVKVEETSTEAKPKRTYTRKPKVSTEDKSTEAAESTTEEQ